MDRMAAAKPQARPILDEHVQAARLRTLLGRRIREIAHIGSTAVPGLAAKPITHHIQLCVFAGDWILAVAIRLIFASGIYASRNTRWKASL